MSMIAPRRILLPLIIATLALMGVGRSTVTARDLSVRGAVPPTVRSQSLTGVTMQVSAGFGGYFRPSVWVPVRMRITNPGPTFSGVLRIDDNGQQVPFNTSLNDRTDYVRTIVMPQGGIKQVTLYVPGADLGPTLTVSLSVNGQIAVQQQATTNSLGLGTLFAGVLSRNANLLAQIKAPTVLTDGQVTAVRLDKQSLDAQSLALDSFDLLILSDFTSSELSSGQLSALEDWVRTGGTLIEIGGPAAQATVNGLPPALRPVAPGQPVTLQNIPSLSSMAWGPLPPGQSVANAGTVQAGTVVLDQEQLRTGAGTSQAALPLVVVQPLGLGAVVYSALDPTIGPVSAWRGLPAFWRLLSSEARTAGAATSSVIAGTQQAAAQNSGGTLTDEIDSATPPSITLFIILLAVYVIALVPLNFILLERFRRRDWSWITLPTLAAILVIATFGSAFYTRGRNVRTSVINVVYLTSGVPRVSVQSYVGLFSPLAGDYTITSADSQTLGTGLFTPNQGSTGQTGTNPSIGLEFAQDTGSARLPNMNMWSSRNLMFTSSTTYEGGLQSDVRVTASGHLSGTLTNNTGTILHGVVLSGVGGNIQGIGDMAPGQVAHINLPSGTPNPSQETVSDWYGTSAQLLTAPDKGGAGQLAVQAPGAQYPLATLSLRVPESALLAGINAVQSPLLLADSTTIPTIPGETPGVRFQKITQQVFAGSSLSAYGSLVVLAWTAQPIGSYSVNGDHPGRQDTDLLVQTVPLTLSRGHFVLNAGTVPARLAGSDQDIQIGSSFGGSGMTISTQSTAVFVAQLPIPAPNQGQLQVDTLNLSVYPTSAGGQLTSSTALLYNWQSGRWVGVDVSNGSVTVQHAGNFVNASGAVRIQINAADSTLTLPDPSGGLALGATGEVR